MAAIVLTHDCDIERRGDGSAPTDVGGDFRDCHIKGGGFATVVYDVTQFNAGILGNGEKGGAYDIHALLWYNLNSFLPAGATITNAVWHINLYSNSCSGLEAFHIDRITQTGWVEGQATWNNYKTGTAWATPGGDFSTPSIVLGAITGTGWKSFNVLSLVSDAWNNRAGICTFLMRRTDLGTADGEIVCHAKDARPWYPALVHHLRVTYTLSGRTFEAIVS